MSTKLMKLECHSYDAKLLMKYHYFVRAAGIKILSGLLVSLSAVVANAQYAETPPTEMTYSTVPPDQFSQSPPEYYIPVNQAVTTHDGTAIMSPGGIPYPAMQGVSSGACQICGQGIDCRDHCGAEPRNWQAMRPLDLDPLWQGEYLGPVRLPSVVDYRVRVGDVLLVRYMQNHEMQTEDYRLMVGDQVMIESVTDPSLTRGDLNRGIVIQQDGTLTLKLIGQVPAAGLTVQQLRKMLETKYLEYVKSPAIDVTPVSTNRLKENILTAVGNQINIGGQAIEVPITPDGNLRLPGIGSVHVQGMTLDEVKREINLKYREIVVGIEVEPQILRLAQRFVYVLGEVTQGGRFELLGPTTVLQALALAGGPRIGGNNRKVVVFRRADDWRMVATVLDLNGAIRGRRPNPADEIWIRDNDLIIVPATPIQLFDNFVQQVFTQGIYGVVPFSGIGIQIGNQGQVQ